MKKPFAPKMLPLKMNTEDIIDIYKIETSARAKISTFNVMLERSVIKDDLLMLFSIDESIQSTKIEGTQATFTDVIEAEVTGNKTKDTTEVINYHKALSKGADLINRLPISTRMFNELHKVILENARGQNRSPGEYRRTQNFIGPTNKIEDATYIPPEPQKVGEYMSNLEKYINDQYEDDFGSVAKSAIIHGQFETIHPYLDGNGRLGRILIILYLLSKGIINSPTFFMSAELEQNKYKYYALLNGLRKEEPVWKDWIIFFIQSAINQADSYINKLTSIENLYKELFTFSNDFNIKNEAILAIFRKPVFNIKQIETHAGISYNTARKYINLLLEHQYIYANDKKRNKLYYFYNLIDLMRK